MSEAKTQSFLEEMRWRGQLHQCTDEAGLEKHLAGGVRRAYAGFDPTADSLTIGNLVTIMALARFQRAGHAPVAVMGGGTGLIGDPSGKSAERQLMTAETVANNVAKIETIFDRILDFSGNGPTRATMINNIDWLAKLSYLEALRDIGKHFSVNMMIQKDSVRDRLHNRDQGISYTEFSYMILQSYDFLHLFRANGVTMQLGGSDQWGNIVGGCDLIRRVASAPNNESFGATWPLVTKSDGGKFGKTESGAIWLTKERTSPFAYYQFWLNAADADVGRFLKTFTFLPQDEIAALEEKVKTEPGAREAQRALAREATKIVHGESEMQQAESAGKALFSGDIAGLSAALLHEVFASAPTVTLPKARLEGEGVALMDLLVEVQAVASKREAKEFLANGSVTVNGQKAGAEHKLKTSDLLHGSVIALRRGKKNWHVTKWE
ncbi:MAG: tyrosine--tRNA ligase [Phycisphaeraceae bacterium]|nr:tyrosine--tRNA ligase [Phycisphaeraceae bacterium]